MIAIVDYRAGNLTSVRLAFESLGIQVRITHSSREILAAERVVFPGVGAAGAAMKNLADLDLIETLKTVAQRGTPFLGICLGMQVMLGHSEEDGGTPCLGLIPGEVRLFRPRESHFKVPHMGWNAVRQVRAHPLMVGIEDDSEFYFVHSYYPDPEDAACRLGETEYGGVRFASVIGRGHLVATQFHPEKSGRIGLRLLSSFASWDGK